MSIKFVNKVSLSGLVNYVNNPFTTKNGRKGIEFSLYQADKTGMRVAIRCLTFDPSIVQVLTKIKTDYTRGVPAVIEGNLITRESTDPSTGRKEYIQKIFVVLFDYEIPKTPEEKAKENESANEEDDFIPQPSTNPNFN